MTQAVLQTELPHAPWLEPALWRLPGTQPLDPSLWLMRDDAFAGQMAVRDELIATAQDRVHALLPEAREAAAECLDLVLEHCGQQEGYVVRGGHVARPDGVDVSIDRGHPLITIGRLVQEDMCILQPGGAAEHVLTGAIMCFPASWTLAEKIGKPLRRIHAPVATYGEDLAVRVQRMFDRLRPETPMWRANALLYDKPDLFQPRRENEETRHISDMGRYLRSERQTIRRLPETGAIVFAIHTYVVALERLSDEQRAALFRVAARHKAESEYGE